MQSPQYARLTTGTHDNPQQAVTDIVVIENDMEGGGSTAWADITGKPATFAPTIGTTASTAVAGNDARLTAAAAGTASVRALGTGATQAAPGTAGLTGSATAVNASTATDAAGLVTDFNALLTALRARGIITGT